MSFRKLAWAAKKIVGIPPRDEVETFARLSSALEDQQRYTRGRFRFPFGELTYIDSHSLISTYQEIFVQRVYDFQAERENTTIIDCGGNVGLSVIWFKQRYPQSLITVFEADPAVADVLTINLEALGLEDVRVINAAAWTEAGQQRFASDGGDGGRIAEEGHQMVKTVRLADFITRAVDLLKLDIEGAEYRVIQDICDAGKIDYVKRLICEVHGRPADRKGFGSIVTALADHGLSFTFTSARCAPDLPGKPEPTPFPNAHDGKFLIHLYAWRP